MTSDKTLFEVELKQNEKGEVVLNFNLGDKIDVLNFQSDDSNEIKQLFNDLLKKAKDGPIGLSLKETDLDSREFGLFIETSTDYIKHLNNDLDSLEDDNDLKTLRSYFSDNH